MTNPPPSWPPSGDAGLSKMTFYRHFPNKVELAKHLLEIWSEQISARIEEIDAMGIPFPQKVGLVVSERVQLARELSPEFIAELYHADPSLAGFLTRQVNMLFFYGVLER